MVGTCWAGETGVYLLGKLCPSPPAELGWGEASLLWGILSGKFPQAASTSLSSADTLFLASSLQKEPGSDCSAWQALSGFAPFPIPTLLASGSLPRLPQSVTVGVNDPRTQLYIGIETG